MPKIYSNFILNSSFINEEGYYREYMIFVKYHEKKPFSNTARYVVIAVCHSDYEDWQYN